MAIFAPVLRQEAAVSAGTAVGPRPKADPQFLALALGDLHTSGRLFMPAETVPGNPVASNPEGG